jgi:alpha-L-fucosidase
MKRELEELITNYGDIGVLWFDGEWENTWNRTLGRELYEYVRHLQPSIIINNRVGAGRSGMEGFSEGEASAGDFGTPEQQIPATGLPGVDWETCMTMNDHWGYNSNDSHWKSSTDLLRMLADIASKGGNFLLNIGPTSAGEFPPKSLDRLQAIGAWMKVNGESIYGTASSPFKTLPWGRCTRKTINGNTRLYLHVFEWPADGRLVVPGILNEAREAYLLADAQQHMMPINRRDDALEISLPKTAPDAVNSVVVLEIPGLPDIADPPVIASGFTMFIDSTLVTIASDRVNVEVRYTTDGTIPTATSTQATVPVSITSSATVTARCFRNGKPVSAATNAKFRKVAPVKGIGFSSPNPGLKYRYVQGKWDSLPDFRELRSYRDGVAPAFDISVRTQPEYYGMEFNGLIRIVEPGVYRFFTESDDGSKLLIGDSLVVNNDFLHSLTESSGMIALGAGFHQIRVLYFQKTGDEGLRVMWMRRGMAKSEIPAEVLFH